MSQEAKPAAAMASEVWDDELAQALGERFPEGALERAAYRGQPYVQMQRESYAEAVAWLKGTQQFDYLADLTAVDYPQRDERFEIVATLYSFARNRYLRVKTRVAAEQAVSSLSDLYAGANWLEREVFDMFGVEFAGHPNLKRILLPEDWQGHPLRKEKSILAMDQEWVKTHLGIESGQ
jgi:NADH-quinone oxidoreductase subunit C